MQGWQDEIIARIRPGLPVLIAGPTASGKSALALKIARTHGGCIVNADAIQVYDGWRILTARPTAQDEAEAPHRLFGHVARDRAYSVGDWLRDVKPLLEAERPIIVGGTGLYFTALTEGLAEIPETPAEIREEADQLRQARGTEPLLAEIDLKTRARIDTQNPMRVQRAWEVQRTTGQGLAAWQDNTPPPLLPLEDVQTVLLEADPGWLIARIERRFEAMMDAGLLDEARRNQPGWSPDLPSSKAIGAAELMAHLDGTMTRETLASAITTLTRQYAKRQRTWFRSRMNLWKSHRCH